MSREQDRSERFRDLNRYDIERTLYENIYELEEDNKEILETAKTMLQQGLSEELIRGKLRQVEDNSAEVIHLTKMVQNEIDSSQFTTATIFRGR